MSDSQTPGWAHLLAAGVAGLSVGAGAGFLARGAVYTSRQQALHKSVMRLGARRAELVEALYREDSRINGSTSLDRWGLWKELNYKQLGMFENFEHLLWYTAAYYIGDPSTVVDVMIRVGYAPTKVPVLRDIWSRRIGRIPLQPQVAAGNT